MPDASRVTETSDEVVDTLSPASATGGSKPKSPVRVNVILPKLNPSLFMATRKICFPPVNAISVTVLVAHSSQSSVVGKEIELLMLTPSNSKCMGPPPFGFFEAYLMAME